MKISEINYLDIPKNKEYEKLINNILKTCFKEEKIETKNIYVNVILTNPENIRKINKEYRNIDKETDVLSFPMFEKNEIESINDEIVDVLGDIVISIKKVEEQAVEFGHSFERELAYMVVHGFYHLMGYDHIEEDEKQEMRKKEEKILEIINIKR